jgi:CRISPR-associated protein Cas2
MPMTVVVTVDVSARFRGFLASCMVEIAPGVYTAPRMTPAVRERVWAVVSDWFGDLGGGAVVMTWREAGRPGGQGILTLGTPRKELYDAEGVILARRPLAAPETEAQRTF